jgi:pSer/pThr/pTyr-binding forkhead associated (FHA) protein
MTCYRPVEGVTTFTVGRSYLCDVTVPPEIAVRSVYKRIAETKHCKLTRLENGKIGLTGYTMAGTFVNGVKVKFLYTAILKDGDVVSLISVEKGPSSTFHTGVSTISSNNVGDVVHW